MIGFRYNNSDYIYHKNMFGDINVCNLFVYCNNNPVMYADPDGSIPQLLGWALMI